MRVGRVKLNGFDGVYHCSNTTVNGEKVFGLGELGVFRDMLYRVADFSGVQVLTYCLMPDHFHLLVRVPTRGDLSDRELVRRYRVLYKRESQFRALSAEQLEEIFSKGGEEADHMRRMLVARMGDLSEFMKTLKQRFSIWFNRSKGRFGPLWSDRFKSVLVEESQFVVETVAAYIDLNPVRAGMVVHPKDYRYSGFGRAFRGGRAERAGASAIYGTSSGWTRYSSLLTKGSIGGDREGDEDFEGVPEYQPGSSNFRSNRLLASIRQFSNGKIIGSKEFVERICDEILILKEVMSRRRIPVLVPRLDPLYSGTRVRRAKTCQSVE